MPTASQTLSEFATRLRFEDLPSPVVAKLKTHVLDLLGVALAAVPLDFAAAMRRVVLAMGGPAACTILGAAERAPAASAALVNGSLAHGLDYDDTHAESVVHVNATVVPTALAAGEESGVDGRGFLTAVALGMEANIRIGLAAPGAFHDRGFHPTGVCGAYASALVAGRLFGLDAAALTNALGLAGSQASGTMEFLTDGTWSKRLHPGWAAHAGIIAARLAEQGFTGPRQTFEGRFGLYRSHLGDVPWSLETLTAGLGEKWHLLDTNLKPYPACHMTHAFIDAAAALQRAHGFAAADVERVECFIHSREVPVVCEPLASKHTPQTDYDAKFSLPYTVAAMLVRGHVDLSDFTDVAIRDQAVLALARRVVYRDDPASDYPRHFGGWLRVHLRDGRSLERHEPINRGHADQPLGDDTVRDKFRSNVSAVISAAQADAAIRAVAELERAGSLDELAQSVRLPG